MEIQARGIVKFKHKLNINSSFFDELKSKVINVQQSMLHFGAYVKSKNLLFWASNIDHILQIAKKVQFRFECKYEVIETVDKISLKIYHLQMNRLVYNMH
ncbi:hypothetical protein BpHYR1_025624 [Brachionus plicatilis]|uniref:Uncharacterized protein n=1 Tax=Brachionus plicatilis TaxID=10195 RepID=A0A3M7SU80_BRAPC|nr:hypothetical protein BpHYR1_025624 [Brachionus plicatilis]